MTSRSTLSIAETLELTLRWNARRILVRTEQAEHTGAEIERATRRIVLALVVQGIGAGNTVCLLGNNSYRYLCCYLAVLRLGAVPAALHARETAESLGVALKHVGAALILADADHVPLAEKACGASGLGIHLINIDSSGPGTHQLNAVLGSEETVFAAPHLSEDAPALILLSSGSTGVPKAVLHSQRTMSVFVSQARTLFGDLGPQTRHLLILGTSFAAWAFTALPVLWAGGCLSIRSGFEPDLFCRTIEKDRINHLATVPTLVRFLKPEITAKYDLTSLKTVLCSGEAPQCTDIDRILSWSPETDVRCLYLASETGPSTATLATRHDLIEGGKLGSAGRPLPFVDLRIVAPEGGIDDTLPPGEIGEICLRGPSVAVGYHADPEKTAAKFVQGWWRSGDLGRLDADGFLFFEGRSDNVINTGGIKVHGEEIEAVLLSHPDIQMAAVVGVPDPKWGHRIVAHVIARRPLDVAAVLSYCEDNGLAGFKKPRELHVHDALPLGPTGKINRNALRK